MKKQAPITQIPWNIIKIKAITNVFREKQVVAAMDTR